MKAVRVPVAVTGVRMPFCICPRKEQEEEQKRREEEEAAEAMRSVTSKDFNIDDFVPMQPAPTAVSYVVVLICSLF